MAGSNDHPAQDKGRARTGFMMEIFFHVASAMLKAESLPLPGNLDLGLARPFGMQSLSMTYGPAVLKHNAIRGTCEHVTIDQGTAEGNPMRPVKRIFDIMLASVLLIVLSPVLCVISVAILLSDGAPVFYFSERMRTVKKSFILWKFRTMKPVREKCGVSGGHTRHRISPFGAWLRRHRLDELPQLINILRGDMSFVGPRPPLRRYVESFPRLYGQVLKMRPGVTGLATLVYHRTEERILQACPSAESAERTYRRRCVPVKARLDLIWARHHSFWFDLRLILETAGRPLWPDRPFRNRAPRVTRRARETSVSLAISHAAVPEAE